jgi:hypothetical protein
LKRQRLRDLSCGGVLHRPPLAGRGLLARHRFVRRT